MTYNAAYAEFYADRTIGSPYTQYKYDQLAQALEGDPYETALDIGCNINPVHPNGLRNRLAAAGVSYVGVDVSPAYFAGAEEPVPAVVGDATALPFKDNGFDAVIAGDVLEHIPPLGRVASEIARVLRPGGRGLIVVPQLYKLDMFNLPEVRAVRPSSHVHFMDRGGWTQAIGQSGLRLSDSESRGLGALSGLLYFAWTQRPFITLDGSAPTAEQVLFSQAKKQAAQADPQADELMRTDEKAANTVADYLQQGRFLDAVGFLAVEATGEAGDQIDMLRTRHAELSSNDPAGAHQRLIDRLVASPAVQAMAEAPQLIGNSVFLNFAKPLS